MILAIDIGGTKTLVAVFDDNKKLVEQIKIPTSKDYSDFLTSLEATKDKLTTKRFFAGAIGTRGIVDRKNGMLIRDSMLGWQNKHESEDFKKIFNCNFTIENDANLAGLSEAHLVGDKYKKIYYITVSTGIGGIAIVDGKFDPNTVDQEPGKMIYPHGGKIKYWEDLASGKALVEKYGKKASEINDPKIWEEYCEYLTIGIINISAITTSECLIIGGGVGSHLDKFKHILEKKMDEYTPKVISKPVIIKAKRPEEAVIYGCLELALQKI